VYLFWKSTALGSLSLSREGITEFINSLLLPSYACKEVALSRAENSLYIVLSLPHPHNTLEVKMLEEKISASCNEMGLGAHISWTEEKQPIEPRVFPEILKNPLSWTVGAAGLTALIHMRIRGVLWTIVVGALTFVIARFLLSENGQILLHRFINRVKQIIRR
jgi:hypothetical protein